MTLISLSRSVVVETIYLIFSLFIISMQFIVQINVAIHATVETPALREDTTFTYFIDHQYFDYYKVRGLSHVHGKGSTTEYYDIF